MSLKKIRVRFYFSHKDNSFMLYNSLFHFFHKNVKKNSHPPYSFSCFFSKYSTHMEAAHSTIRGQGRLA